MSPKQIRAAELLGQGFTQQEIADQIHVSRRTIIRWCQDPSFKNLAYGLRSRPTHQENIPLRSRIENLSQWNLDDPLSRDEAHQELRKLEWQISIAILQKALVSLENLEFSRVRDLMNSVEIASNLARKSGEIWSSNINAAIDLLKRYDFDVIDKIELENSETDGSNKSEY